MARLEAKMAQTRGATTAAKVQSLSKLASAPDGRRFTAAIGQRAKWLLGGLKANYRYEPCCGTGLSERTIENLREIV